MRRFLLPIILFVVGLLLAVAGILNLLPGMTGGGGGLCFLGLLLFGLSFIPQPEVAADAPAPLSPFERIARIFYEPTRVFQNLRAHPRWLVAVLIISLMSIIYSTAFTQRVTPERIAEHISSKMKDLEEKGWVPPGTAEKSKEGMIKEAKNPFKRVSDAINTVVGTIVLMAFLSALYLLVVLMFGGRINFWQAMAATVHAALPVIVIGKLLSLVILYVKQPDEVPPLLGQNTLVQDNLSYFFSPADHPVFFVLASAIGILSFYHLWLTATGLKNAGQKVSSAAGWTGALVVWFLTILFGVVWAALFPSFLS